MLFFLLDLESWMLRVWGGQKHEWIETVSNHDLIQWHHPTKFPYMQRCALWNSAPKRTLDVLGIYIYIYIWFQDNFILVFKDLRYRTKGLGEFVVISPEVECFLKGFGGFLRILGKTPKYVQNTYFVRTGYVPQTLPVQRPYFARKRPWKCVLEYVFFPYSGHFPT